MDVSVLSKDGQRSLRSAIRTSVLGDGLLERTRSTTLALLGLIAAIGLAMVALALNQDWPLIAGAPIPGLEREHHAVGDATVAATARMQGGRAEISGTTSQANPGVSSGKPRPRAGGTAALAGSKAPQAAGLVVAHPTAPSPAGNELPSEAVPDPTPAAQQPAPAPAPAPATAAAAVPVSSPSSPSPGPVPQTTPEAPIPSQAPPATDEGDEHGHDHHFGGGTSHGHGHSRGGDDAETPEPSEGAETAPVPTEAPPPEADEPDESESDQSRASSWSHGSGHGYGYGHGRGHW
jgi:hypothetical protein